MLGIRDILVLIRIRGFVPLTNRTGSNSGSGSFFSDFKDAKKLFFLIFFSYNLPAGTLSSDLEIQFCAEFLFCKHYFSPLNTFMRRGKNPEPDPEPYLWLFPFGSGSGSGRPKNMRIRIPNTGLINGFFKGIWTFSRQLAVTEERNPGIRTTESYLMNGLAVRADYPDVNVKESALRHLEHQTHLCPRLHLWKEQLFNNWTVTWYYRAVL